MSEYGYTVTRVLDAPVHTVWQVWTEAGHYEHLFHAVPGSVRLDVRPGGHFEVTMNVPEAGGEVPMSGGYREVVPDERLVTTMNMGDREAVMAMTFAAADGGTRVTVTQDDCRNEQERDGSREGTEILLQWCADYLATL